MYQALVIERNMLSERLQVNQNLQAMESMRNELSMSEQDLQIQELVCKMSQRQDTIDSLKAH